MSGRDELEAVLAGRRCDAVLHHCRLQAFGREQYGQEAIRAAFRARPHRPSDAATLVETPGQLALFDEDLALVADLHDGRFARLWRVGPSDPVAAEPAISVPFDADLRQARGDVLFRAEDHPHLPADWLKPVADTGRLIVDAEPEVAPAPYRERAFLIRAFGTEHRAAALFATFRLGGAAVRASGFTFAAACLSDGAPKIVRDPFVDRAWRSAF